MSGRDVYIGTDGGATTSKVAGVWVDGRAVSTKLLQRPTNSEAGPEATVSTWTDAIADYLAANGLGWNDVRGVGLAIPGPYERYGVFGHSPNLPPSFEGFDVHTSYQRSLERRAARPIQLTVGNDGNMGGVAEAQRARGDADAAVVMLAPGSGLGCAYVDSHGLPLDGDTISGMEAAHMPAPLHLLDARPYTCGCGRTWGCVEMYTTLAGLPNLLAERLDRYPQHELATSTATLKQRAFTLRSLAQKDDPLAVEIFDFQAKALGLHVATLSMALDARFGVIGGGLMDPESTTDAFRKRYLRIIAESAAPYLWPSQRATLTIVPASLGDLSQAIGAALVACYRARMRV